MMRFMSKMASGLENFGLEQQWLLLVHPKYLDYAEYNFLKQLIKPDNENHQSNRSKYKIVLREVIPQPQIAWSLTNTKSEGEAILGTLGDFGLIIGKAKSRKSFYISIAVSTALSKDLILNRFKSYLLQEQNEVVYFET